MMLIAIKVLLLFGMALWLTIACTNNMIDSKTNKFLINQMFSMQLLREDTVLGQGLLHRAIKSPLIANLALRCVIAYQVVICVLLWAAVLSLLLHLSYAMNVANAALFAFLSLWFSFLCGGLWFGYWIKTGQIQMVHFTLVIVGLLATIVINLPVH